MSLSDNKIYMIGIGGIGMSGLAQLLKHQGHEVSGTDRENSPTTELLMRRGFTIAIGEESAIPEGTELVVYSDAVWPDHPQRVEAQGNNIPQLSYFEFLGEISKGMRTLAVGGTHGKTTTTGMLAAILQAARENPTAIVGSIVSDFGSNFLAGKNDLFVVEACEYRDHILRLTPEVLVITNIELDHTDFFESLEDIQKTFRTAMEKVPAEGAIVTNPNDPIIAPLLEGLAAPIIDYTKETVPTLSLIGDFNRANAQAAKAAAKAAFPGISESIADETLATFKGSWRRFEFKGETANGALVYDDYAHHPTAIAKTIQAAREKFTGKRVVVAFHPHLYSRTKSLLKDFASALATADETFIAPIYAAREAPDPSVSNAILAEAVTAAGGSATAGDFEDIRRALVQQKVDTLIITMGAGDIYKVAEQIVRE